jgi:hypothetical protein
VNLQQCWHHFYVEISLQQPRIKRNRKAEPSSKKTSAKQTLEEYAFLFMIVRSSIKVIPVRSCILDVDNIFIYFIKGYKFDFDKI